MRMWQSHLITATLYQSSALHHAEGGNERREEGERGEGLTRRAAKGKGERGEVGGERRAEERERGGSRKEREEALPSAPTLLLKAVPPLLLLLPDDMHLDRPEARAPRARLPTSSYGALVEPTLSTFSGRRGEEPSTVSSGVDGLRTEREEGGEARIANRRPRGRRGPRTKERSRSESQLQVK
eukprot:scaffold35308_cov32-Tisochrysis_lutea.AAC.8